MTEVVLEPIKRNTYEYIAANLRKADYEEIQKVMQNEKPHIKKIVRKTVKSSYLTGVVRNNENKAVAIFGFSRKPKQLCKDMFGEVCWLLATDGFLDKKVIVPATKTLRKIVQERLEETPKLFNLISLENEKYLNWLHKLTGQVRFYQSKISDDIALFTLEK